MMAGDWQNWSTDGSTPIEPAIVLVKIGLLARGILIGQDLTYAVRICA